MRPFKNVFGNKPRISVFDLSYEKKLTCDMGQLIPVLCDEVVPGDYWKIGNQAIIRMQPLVAPVLHQIDVYVHYFFVPYRLLWDGFEDFITNPDSEEVLPLWNPTKTEVGSLWDFLGFPLGVVPKGILPVDFPRRAYNYIWNEYYRDEDLQTEVLLTNEDILNRDWEKDYFTSARPWQQKGTPPALPITGIGHADFTRAMGGTTNSGYVVYDATKNLFLGNSLLPGINKNDIDLSTATTFNVSDIRLAVSIQKWMERNARGGNRYIEFLKSHFGVNPKDERLQRPEYLGGTKVPIILSEVLQTSETGTTPLGQLGGHGIGVSSAYAAKAVVREFGLVIGLMSIMPKPAYMQGVNRQWIKDTLYDFFFPEFVGISEQEVLRGELYATAVEADNKTVFGFQGRFDEMRYKPNLVVGEMRTVFDYWHLAREFAGAPLLNDSFVKCNPDKRIFAVQNVPGFIVQFGNIIKALRPLPMVAEPGIGRI